MMRGRIKLTRSSKEENIPVACKKIKTSLIFFLQSDAEHFDYAEGSFLEREVRERLSVIKGISDV